MNPFDLTIIRFVNGFAHHSVFFDTFVYLLGNNLLKGGVVVALLWWAWFRADGKQIENRQYLLCGIVACLLSIVVARAMADTLPYRERPLRNPAVHFQLPYGDDTEALIHWSAFPSDHAALFFALATAVFFAWRTAGILCFCHVFFLICLPRIYLGFHHPTDILAGAAIGIGIASLARNDRVRKAVWRAATPWLEGSPGSFYACMFLMTFQIATLFAEVRDIGQYFAEHLKMH